MICTFLITALVAGIAGVGAFATDEKAYSDVSDSSWYYHAVSYSTDTGLMNGIGDEKFGPENSVTRAMTVTVLYRIEDEPAMGNGKSGTFVDVPEDLWYTDAVEWAAAMEVVQGYGDGNFGPNDNITREQMATMLYRYAQYKDRDVSIGEETDISSYDDAENVSEYAVSAMQWAVGSGLIEGRTDSTLVPLGTASRAELATILMRFDATMVTGAYENVTSIVITDADDTTRTLEADDAQKLFSALENAERTIKAYPEHIDAQTSDPVYIITITYNDETTDVIYSTETGEGYYRLLDTFGSQGDQGYVYTANPDILDIISLPGDIEEPVDPETPEDPENSEVPEDPEEPQE